MESTPTRTGRRPPTRPRLSLGLLLQPGPRRLHPKQRRASLRRRRGPKPPAAAAPRHQEGGNVALIVLLVAQRALVALVQEFGQLLAQHLVALAAMADQYGALE